MAPPAGQYSPASLEQASSPGSPSATYDQVLTYGRLNKAKFSLMTILVQYEQSDYMITILNHSLMTKKHLHCIILIVQILGFM